MRTLLSPFSKGAYVPFSSGSLISSSGKRDPRRAKMIKEKLIQALQHSDRAPLALDGRLAKARGIGGVKESVGYSLESLRDAVTATLRNYPAATYVATLSDRVLMVTVF